jgi:uncharacterized protein (TIGR03435 family)
MKALLLAALIAGAFAQAPSTASFEVATMKLAPIRSGREYIRSSGGPGTDNPTRVTLRSISLRRLLMDTFRLKEFQIEGPGWIDTVTYDIDANVPAGVTRDQYLEMLFRLVSERLKLKTHREQKDFPTYTLVVAEKGFKLQPAAPSSGVLAGSIIIKNKPGAGLSAVSNAAAISALKNMLEGQFDESFVVDKTGLQDRYSFTLDFAPVGGFLARDSPNNPNPANVDGLTFPSIFTALQEQLGLKLEKGKASHDILIIDSGDKTPLEN